MTHLFKTTDTQVQLVKDGTRQTALIKQTKDIRDKDCILFQGEQTETTVTITLAHEGAGIKAGYNLVTWAKEPVIFNIQ